MHHSIPAMLTEWCSYATFTSDSHTKLTGLRIMIYGHLAATGDGKCFVI